MRTCLHCRQRPIGPRATYELVYLRLAGLELVLVARQVLQQKSLEIAEAVEDEAGYLAEDRVPFFQLFLELFLQFLSVQQLQQRFAFETAQAGAAVPTWGGGIPGRASCGVCAPVGNVAKDLRRVMRVEGRVQVANTLV